MKKEIEFGTGGWRAVIADGFTKENIRLLAQSMIPFFNKKEVIIGFDKRFLSIEASKWLAEVFAGNNIKVYFIKRAVPTPIIMFAVNQLELDYGLAVTASHNPAIYNGVKVFTKGGRDANLEVTSKLQESVEKTNNIISIDFEEGLEKGIIEYYNPRNDYIDAILNHVDTKIIRDVNLRVVVDTMYGVSKTALSMILSTARVDVDVINERHDTLFGGKLPSPESSTLHKLSDLVIDEGYDMGIATDGDADRIGIIDENGRFIHPNLLLALIYEYQLTEKGLKGPAVRNLSTTHLLDKIAKKHGQYVVETPVGFKNITDGMEEHNAIIGGESSGGLTVAGHIKGKDGIFAATIIVEMIAKTKQSIGQLVNNLYKEYGDLYNDEKSFTFSHDDKKRINQILFIDKQIPSFNKPIQKVSYMDGLKIYFEDDSWISARFSGTEPLLRIFVESDCIETNKTYIKEMKTLLNL